MVSATLRGLALVILTLVLVGCSVGPVVVDAPRLAESEQPQCRDFIGELPAIVAGFERREIESPGGFAAAWGAPPLIVTCGGQLPDDFTQLSGCEEIAGIGWFTPDAQLEDPTLAATVTTVGIHPLATVSIPAQRRGNAAEILTAVAPAIKQSLLSTEPCV